MSEAMKIDQANVRWHNPRGYRLRGPQLESYSKWIPWRKVAWYEYTLDAAEPLTLEVAPNVFIQPDRHCWTNWGSIPPWLQIIPGLEAHRFPDSYLLHDSVCKRHTLYFASQLAGPYVEAPVRSETAHGLLRASLVAEGCLRVGAATIWAFVRVFGPRWC